MCYQANILGNSMSCWDRQLEAAAPHCQASELRGRMGKGPVPKPESHPFKKIHTHWLCCMSSKRQDTAHRCEEDTSHAHQGAHTIRTMLVIRRGHAATKPFKPKPFVHVCPPHYEIVCIREPKSWTDARCQPCSCCSAVVAHSPACLLHLCAAFAASCLPQKQAVGCG
jgi:hypothetical protein